MFLYWLMAKQPSHTVTTIVALALDRVNALRARVLHLPPEMEEGIEKQ
jgi:hypothetical protein